MDSKRPGRPRRATTSAGDFADDALESAFDPLAEAGLAGAPRDLPVLPVRNTVLLPHMIVPLFVDREPALRAVEYAMAHDHTILIVTQKSEQISDPAPHDVYTMGTECVISRMTRLNDGATSVMAQGLRRFRIQEWLPQPGFGRARGVAYEEPDERGPRIEALARAALNGFEDVTRLSAKLTEESYLQALSIETPGSLSDFIASQIEISIEARQDLLETLSPAQRLRRVTLLLRHEVNVLELERKIQDEVQREVDRGQREFYLREELRAIHRELGERDPMTRDNEELRDRVLAAGMTDEAQTRALRELERMEAMPPMAPEYGVLRAYLDWLIALPWSTRTTDTLDLRRVAATLDANHFGLQKVKDRIIEFMAVRKLAPEGRAPILCFAGPPGVGKTSLGRSIAEAMDRKFVRVSLGGVRDEAEIRGHRRTYVGALPGRILQTMKQAGVINPVFVLDEIDKLSSDFRGDPSSALLEALDPEQNNSFSDHYLEIAYDLSKVMFIMTANTLQTIPPALRDRMEVIELPGYTEEEKSHIARQFLIPRQMSDSGLTPSRIEIDDDAVSRIIREYTYEAGVRGLEREIAAIMRRVARRVAEGRRHPAHVTAQRVPAYLGPQKHYPTEAEADDLLGAATGLAWTPSGGDLTLVEAQAVPGHGAMILTGQLGDVMKESAQAALTLIRARAAGLGLAESFHERTDMHIHLPAAGIPKDGPSAGVTMIVAMISALIGQHVRRDVAMTGEITLRGRVLPVGGVKEKALAASRAGITTVLLPRRNLRDLDDAPQAVRDRLRLIAVDTIDDVIAHALRAPARGAAVETAIVSGALSGRAPRPSQPLTDAVAASGRDGRDGRDGRGERPRPRGDTPDAPRPAPPIRAGL
jgi:ATP-dependent Lon protease